MGPPPPGAGKGEARHAAPAGVVSPTFRADAMFSTSVITDTVNAVKQPWERKPHAHATADKLATAVALDMTAHWTPTVRAYLGRVTKAHILAAVGEAVSDEATERLAGLKKTEMAEAAEQLLVGTGWLPAALRTARPAWLDEPQADEVLQIAAQ